jgi:hypothetical protein
MIIKQHISSRPAVKASLTAALAVLLSCGSPLHAEDIDTANLDSITNAPIIESGRLVGTITNTTASLNHTYKYPLIYNPKMNKDYSMDGEWVNSTGIPPEESIGKVTILKVEDDIATILVKTPDRPILPAVTVPYDNIPEIKGMPHLTDGNPQWISSKQIMESMQGVTEVFSKEYVEYDESLEKTRNGDYLRNRLKNYRLAPWRYSKIVDEYQKLQVPITTELPAGDNSSVVAVANALNYLYTKANTNPTQVSKSFLTWAHDSYPLNNNQLNTAWHPSDNIDPKKMEEGERIGHKQLTHFLHPEAILVPVVSGQEHRIDLGRLLKGVQRFGVALEKENPSTGKWSVPSTDTLSTASSRIDSHKIVVRCFNAWNDNYLFRDYQGHGEMDKEEAIYRAQFLAFVTREVTSGHPVIITFLKEIQPSTLKYIKQSYVITGSGNLTHNKSLQFLTPSGTFESYDLFAKGGGEVMPADNGNPFGRLLEGLPFSRSYVGWNPQMVWKKITYARSDYKPQATSTSFGADHKYEVYSLGFE